MNRHQSLVYLKRHGWPEFFPSAINKNEALIKVTKEDTAATAPKNRPHYPLTVFIRCWHYKVINLRPD